MKTKIKRESDRAGLYKGFVGDECVAEIERGGETRSWWLHLNLKPAMVTYCRQDTLVAAKAWVEREYEEHQKEFHR